MPFFQVDDQLQVNPKVRELAERTLGSDLTGVAALGLWTLAGSLVQAGGTDGLVKHVDCVRILLNPKIASQLAGLLVDAGLWHAHGHGCERCAPVELDHYRFHDWSEWYDPAASTKVKRQKAKELKNPTIIAEVWARDCADFPHATVGICRYCSKRMNRKTTRGPDRPHLDHVDPTRANGVRNIVLACEDCNKRKGARTPEQAGMVLRPAPSRRVDAGAEVSSPAIADAGLTPASPTPAPETVDATEQPAPAAPPADPPPDQSRYQPGTTPGTAPDQSLEGVLGRAHGRTRAGQGQGGDGLPPGSPQGQPRRRRRRGRGGSGSQARQVAEVSHDAGPPPEGVVPPGRWGSPYYGWSGKGSDVTETTCPTHGLEEPCWKCERESQ